MNPPLGKVQEFVENKFGNRYRMRACGILVRKDEILVVKNLGVGKKGHLWGPPGGEVHFGEPLKAAVSREFLEETGLIVKAKKFLFISEFIKKPLHAIECFWEVELVGGELVQGSEPEYENISTGIDGAEWLPFSKLKSLSPIESHRIFSKFDNIASLVNSQGEIL